MNIQNMTNTQKIGAGAGALLLLALGAYAAHRLAVNRRASAGPTGGGGEDK